MTLKQVVANLQGIFPPVVTPFNRRGDIDEGLFRENISRYAGIGLAGVLVSGSTGEMPYLTPAERLRLTEIARAVVKPPEIVLVGTGLESTRETIGLSREAVARGADGLLVLPPNYYKARMDGATLEMHYRALADAVRRPIVIYSIPQFSGINIPVETVARLSHHPHIVGLKESSGKLAFVRQLVRGTKPGFRVLVGAVSILLVALRSGAAGAVLGQADFAPDLCVAVYEAFRQRRWKSARDLQQRLLPLATQISLPHGVPGIKAAMDLAGYAGGLPRPPLLPVDSVARQQISAALQEARAGLEF
ncbi:MAG: dihydrodipicolinate synthase family protein [Terriglobia bacterium]